MRFFDILQWTIVAAIAVAVIANMQAVAGGIQTFGTFWTQETSIIASAGAYQPKLPKGY